MKKTGFRVKDVYIMLMIYTFAFWFSKELAKPAISIALADENCSSSTIGFLLSMQNFLPLILSIPLAFMGDKFGHEKILHMGSVLTVISGSCFLGTGGVRGTSMAYPLMLTIGQIFSGIAWTFAWISLQTLISDCDEVNKAKGENADGVNRMILIMSIGMILGPLLAGEMIDSLGIYSVWMLNMLLCLLQIGLSFALLKRCQGIHVEFCQERSVKGAQGQKKASLFSQLGGGIYLVMISFSFIMMFGSEIKGSFMSVILREAGMDSKMIGCIASAGSLATCVVRIFMNARAAAKMSGKSLIYISMGCMVFAMAGFTFFPVGNLYLISSILIGLCAGIVEPVLILYILEYAIPERKGLALTGRVLFNRLAMFLAPTVAGLSVSTFGIKGGFGEMTLMISIIILITICGMSICFKGGKKYEYACSTKKKNRTNYI